VVVSLVVAALEDKLWEEGTSRWRALRESIFTTNFVPPDPSTGRISRWRALRESITGPKSNFRRRHETVPELENYKRKALLLHDQSGELDHLRKKLVDKAEGEAALRRKVNVLRKKLADKAEGEAALRREQVERESTIATEINALRREVTALREQRKEAEIALREQRKEAEIAERAAARIVEQVVGHKTPQRSSDAQTPSTNDVRSGKFERNYLPPNPGSRGGVPYVDWNPENRQDEAWEKQKKEASGGDHHGEWYSG
jgi:hypothetical protein